MPVVTSNGSSSALRRAIARAREIAFCLVFAVVLAAPPVHAEQKTIRITPPPFQPGGCTRTNNPACGWASAEDPNKVIANLVHDEAICNVFTDPVPPHATVKSIDLRFAWPQDRAPQTYTVGLTGPNATSSTPIGSFIHAEQPVPQRCEPPYVPLPIRTMTGIVFPNGIPTYAYGGSNALVFSNTIDFEFIDIILNFKRAPKVEFDLTDTSPEQDRRVLIRQGRPDFPYFSSAQATLPATGPGRDGRIRIAGTLRDEDGPVANRAVHLRVTDPPDVAPYVPIASRRPNDNAAGTGSLASTTVTTDGSGRFETVLTVTSFASGDNYQIEGSVVPAFGGKTACDETNVCAKSGVLTAWKRVFLETGLMFRRGAYLAVSAQAGDPVVVVDDIAPFQPGMRIALLHGPSASRMNPPQPAAEYAYEETTIEPDGVEKAASGPGGRLHLTNPLSRPYDGINGAAGHPSTIADFVGILTGNGAQDFYGPNNSYLQSLFGDAFVDYVLLPPEPAPFVESIQEDINSMQPADELHDYVRRWFRYYGLPNHQYLLGSREGSSVVNGRRGVTRSFNGLSYSHVMVRPILGVLSTASSQRLLGELTAHEVAHQWHTNRRSSHTTTGEHCDFSYYDDPNKRCVMHQTYSSLPEFFDNIVRFHYVSDATGVDSEYRWIRERCDPMPANTMTGSSDWWTQPAPPCR